MSMKKSILGLAAMAVAVSMASCSLDEVMEQPAEQTIGFSSFVGKPTKSVTETTATVLQGEGVGFKVWGGYAGKTDLFAGRAVTYASNAWGYQNVEYWVPSQTYRFAAVGPSSAVPSGTAFTYDDNGDGHDGFLKFTYSQADLTKSVDVVYAESGDKKAPATITDADPQAVSFTFGHIMSWIKIKFVHKMTTGYKITVSDVKVDGVKTGAEFTGSGTSTGSWGTTLSTDAYLGNSSTATVDPDIFSTGVTALPLDAANEYCMVDFIAVPQTIAANLFEISFKLKVQDSEDNYLVGTKDAGVDFSTTLTSAQTWAVNNVYVYTADLKSSVLGMYPIKFTVSSVGTWGTDADTDLTVSSGSN